MRNNKDTSFLYIFPLFFLISAWLHLTWIHRLALQHTNHQTPRTIEGYTYAVYPTFGKQTKSFFCYPSTSHMEQCNAISCHSTTLLIAQSMDVHPNPRPTMIHIKRDLTTLHQCKLFDNTKHLPPKVTRYEHHISNYNYYRTHKIISKGLSIKCKPPFGTDDEHIFFEAGDYFLGKHHFRWWTYWIEHIRNTAKKKQNQT